MVIAVLPRKRPLVFGYDATMAEPNVMFDQMPPDTSYVENFCLRVYLQNWLRYHHSKFQFCLLPSAIKFWAMTTKLDSRKAQVMSYVSWKFERNRRSTYWDTALWTGQGWCRLLVITAWAYSLTELLRLRASQESFSRPNEATLELPDCCKTFLGPLGTFYTWFHGRKTRISWDLAYN